MPRRDDDEFALAAERPRAAGWRITHLTTCRPRQTLLRQEFPKQLIWRSEVVGRHLNRHAGPLTAQCCGFDASLSDTLGRRSTSNLPRRLVAAHVGFRVVGKAQARALSPSVR